MTVFGLIFTIVCTLIASYFVFGAIVIIMYETFLWGTEKGGKLYDFVVEKWFWWM
jgi:hypothetical protein